MSPDKIELLIRNDREWRTHILNKLDKLEENQIKNGLYINTLKTKMGILGFISGIIGSFVYKNILNILK